MFTRWFEVAYSTNVELPLTDKSLCHTNKTGKKESMFSDNRLINLCHIGISQLYSSNKTGKNDLCSQIIKHEELKI